MPYAHVPSSRFLCFIIIYCIVFYCKKAVSCSCWDTKANSTYMCIEIADERAEWQRWIYLLYLSSIALIVVGNRFGSGPFAFRGCHRFFFFSRYLQQPLSSLCLQSLQVLFCLLWRGLVCRLRLVVLLFALGFLLVLFAFAGACCSCRAERRCPWLAWFTRKCQWRLALGWASWLALPRRAELLQIRHGGCPLLQVRLTDCLSKIVELLNGIDPSSSWCCRHCVCHGRSTGLCSFWNGSSCCG